MQGNACVFPFSLIKITSMLQGEAFVPESIVRFGTREKGRDGVHTLKAEDDRIKWVSFSKSLIVLNCEHPWKLHYDYKESLYI